MPFLAFVLDEHRDWSYNSPRIASSSRQLMRPGAFSGVTTASGRARRGWLPFSSRAGGVALTSTKECNRATRTSASRRETDCERCVQERGEKRREGERGRGGEKRLGERFVGTKGRRRDGADSVNAGCPDAFSCPFYIASPVHL